MATGAAVAPPGSVPRVRKIDWELFACGLKGHETYRPDEPDVAERVRGTTAQGDESWWCLRCGDFIPGTPKQSGPRAAAPQIPRGGLLRDIVIMRLLAIDRFIHFLGLTVIGAVIIGLETPAGAQLRDKLTEAIPRLAPAATELGWNVSEWKTMRMLEEAVDLRTSTVIWIGIAVLCYGVLELIEATGLWLGKRWGEYFSVIVTSVFIPLEIYELLHHVTVFKAAALIINLAAVIWLIWRKRLFGVRGGDAANRAQHEAVDLLD